MPPNLDRRAFLALGVGALAWACARGSRDEAEPTDAPTEEAGPPAPSGAGPVSNVISAAQSEVSEAGGEGIAATDETRRRVSRELLAPRSAVDEVASPPDS